MTKCCWYSTGVECDASEAERKVKCQSCGFNPCVSRRIPQVDNGVLKRRLVVAVRENRRLTNRCDELENEVLQLRRQLMKQGREAGSCEQPGI